MLLPVPLVLVLVAAHHEGRSARARVDILPVLTFEERTQRTTYMRRCETSAECEPPLGCLNHWKLRMPVCIDSECMTDTQCGEGRSCQLLETQDPGPRVGTCVAKGVRREGERCRSIPTHRDDACEPGLQCFEGWCGRPCLMDAPERCPEGFSCAEDRAVCLPSCEARGCPEGQQCIQLNNRAASRNGSTCVVVHGDNCQQSACPEGLLCQVFDVPRRPGEAWMGCRQRCGEGRPACAEGLLCRYGYCRQPCDPQASGGCGSGEKCDRYAPEEPWVCQPDW